MEQIQKIKEKRATESQVTDVPVAEVDAEIEAHKEHSDELLDEIDALLEDNAAEFVANYVQRGGE